MTQVQVKIRMHAITRRIAQQVPVVQHLSAVEFRMIQWDGWITEGAVTRDSSEYFLAHIGTRSILYPTILVLEPMRTHLMSTLPQIFIP